MAIQVTALVVVEGTAMTITPAADAHTEDMGGPDGRPWCEDCDTDEYLVVESIGPLSPAARDLVEVEYSCAVCEGYYAHVATVGQVANLLDMEPAAPGVLHFGHEYIHCGEVMQDVGADDAPDFSGFMSTAKILRCRCGFRLVRPL